MSDKQQKEKQPETVQNGGNGETRANIAIS
jgi:hypothetical protein